MLDRIPSSDSRGAPLGCAEVLVFELAGQRHAIEVGVIQELVRAVSVVPLPRGPEVVEGIIDVRGSLVPVLDLRRRFLLPPRPPHHADHLILALAGPRLVALRCDRAIGLVRLSPGQIEDVRRAVPAVSQLAGVSRLPDGLVLIHDLRTFVSLDEGAALDGALREAAHAGTQPPGSEGRA